MYWRISSLVKPFSFPKTSLGDLDAVSAATLIAAAADIALILDGAGVIRDLVVDPGRMRENLDLTYGALFSQRLLLALVARGLSRDDAYMLSSVAIDFDITQLVDGTKGVHAMIPKSLFTSAR